MVMLVSLQQASEHLRRDTTDDDADLTLKIRAASGAILNYMAGAPAIVSLLETVDSFGELPVDSSGDPEGVPEPLQVATLMMIGIFYADRDGQEYREGQSEDRLGKMSLPRAVHWLLDPLRDPRMA